MAKKKPRVSASSDPHDAAWDIFNSIDSLAALKRLIADGEAEGLYIECKAPSEPRLNRDLKSKLGKALSGFSNTSGGVMIWGMSTSTIGGRDVMTQLSPIGNVKQFAKRLESAVPALATPGLLRFRTAVLKERPSDTRGVVVAYVPRALGDPVQSTIDDHFYFRSDDEFVKAPYDMIKRLFAATDSPDITFDCQVDQAVRSEDGTWSIPMSVSNRSSAIGQHLVVSLEVLNPTNCDELSCTGMKDASAINPGMTIFVGTENSVVHRRIQLMVGNLLVRMMPKKRRLALQCEIFADRMRARGVPMTLMLGRSSVTAVKNDEFFLY